MASSICSHWLPMAVATQGLPALEYRPHLVSPLAEGRDLGRYHESLRQQVRRRAGRHPSPRSSAVDSQSVKTTTRRVKGFDSGKRSSGRKRHIWVDSMGLLLAVLVTAANVTDARAACQLLHSRLWDELPRLEWCHADRQYRGRNACRKRSLRGRRLC